MTIALATLAGVLALGYIPVFLIVLRHLKDRDALERDERARAANERDAAECRHAAQVEQLVSEITAAHQARTAELTDLQERVQEAHRSRAEEITGLLQRIQAPEIAVVQHQIDTNGPGDAVLPLNDEESAKRAEEVRVQLERIEEIEREGVY